MTDPSLMFSPRNSGASPSAISSQGSEDGRKPSSLPAGPPQKLYGLAPVLAKGSPVRLEAATMQTTYGRYGFRSSRQAALERSLVSRLPLGGGSIVSATILSPWVMRSGRRFCRLSVSAKTISDTGFTLHATPTATANQAAPSIDQASGMQGHKSFPRDVVRAHGVSSRVAQMRAFGNAIIPSLAAEFIRAAS